MGRQPRLCQPEIICHVTARGDNRESVFRDNSDYQRYLQLLREYKTKWSFRLFCYALMPNHVHLLLQTSQGGSLSQILHDIQSKYSKYFNHRHERIGHVFQGRYHASIIEKESYLLTASRYIHRNPIEAKLGESVNDYPWTSFHAYADPTKNHLGLVDTDFILSMCATDKTLQRSAYQNLVETKWCQAPNC